jgi:DNA-binding NtrC family response regulator
MLTGNATLETAIEAMKAGAYDYLTKPCKIEELDVLIRKACERRDLQKDNLYMQTRLSRKESAPLLVTNNRKMKELLTLVEKMAVTDSSALILGEGTGKEPLAQSFHQPPGAGKPLSTLTAELLWKRFGKRNVGYEKGAFTNADSSGLLFELADRGTLFMDEVGELSPRLQVKLLRVLEARTFSCRRRSR